MNLCSNHLCSVHDKLMDKGFKGCISYECFGAGQHVSQTIYEGRSWREDQERAKEMFAVFPVVQQLHEMLWYLQQALSLKESREIHPDLQEAYEKTVQLTFLSPEEILDLDVHAHRTYVNRLLVETSRLFRADFTHKDKVANDYIGGNLKGRDLRGKNFRGKLMIAANLSRSDLRKADFIGADMRDADLSGADLRGALFITQSQINSAKGDIHTLIPVDLKRPDHWSRER